MKKNDFNKLFRIGVLLGRQCPNLSIGDIENFLLELHAYSIKINRLNRSIAAIIDNVSKELVADRARTIEKAEGLVIDFNRKLARNIAITGKFRIEVLDPAQTKLEWINWSIRLHYTVWSEPVLIPFSQ